MPIGELWPGRDYLHPASLFEPYPYAGIAADMFRGDTGTDPAWRGNALPWRGKPFLLPERRFQPVLITIGVTVAATALAWWLWPLL